MSLNLHNVTQVRNHYFQDHKARSVATNSKILKLLHFNFTSLSPMGTRVYKIQVTISFNERVLLSL